MTAPGNVARLGGYQGPGSILTRALAHFAQGVGDAGLPCAIEGDVTAAGATARSLFDNVQSGARQACYAASGYLAAQVPELALLDMPFSVRDRAVALQALAADVGHALADAVARQTPLRVLSFWDNGFRHISNGRHAIHGPDDCRGLVLRTLDSADYRAAMAALGFNAVTTDVRELRDAVATGRVDAQENPLTNFVNFELWRHHRHLSLTSHLYGVALLVCNRAWFDALTAMQQAAVTQSAREATALQHTWAAQEDVTALARLRQTDVLVVPPEAIQLRAMQHCCQPLLQRRLAELPAALTQAYLQ